MILDILFVDAPPEQIQHVRMFTFYNHPSGGYGPELVIHSSAGKAQRNIEVSRVYKFTVTNN